MKTKVLNEVEEYIALGKLGYGKADPNALIAFKNSRGADLPGDYLDFLERFNGIQENSGYFRIFGVGEKSEKDAVNWNQHSTWKDAWPDTVNDYWCFAETAWGDQYAFKLGGDEPTVFFLEAVTLTPEPIASDFVEFLTKEFLRNVNDPYDVNLKEARRTIGPLSSDEHITYVPSILISGAEDRSSIQKMPAAASMIINGDLFRQLGQMSVECAIERVEIQNDCLGRSRAKVIWAG